jgi:NADH-quinone oxidoreductase subunit C
MSNDSFKKGLDDLETGPRTSGAEAAAPEQADNLPPHASVDALRDRFGEAMLRHEVTAGDEHVVYIPHERNLEVLGWLKDDPSQRYDFLADLTAVDYGHGMFLQVVYQLWSMEHKRQLRLKAEVPMDGLEIESVYYLWRAADWMEREAFDLFGIVFRGHPDLRRIMMPYNYAEGHPLRKDFPLRGRFSRAEQTRRALSMKTEDHYSPYELELAKRLRQPLPDVMVEGGPGVPNPGVMPGIGGSGSATA